jgi:polyhydroxyalkanoate synthase
MNDYKGDSLDFEAADPEAFAHNLAKLYEEYGKAMAAFLEPREKGLDRSPMPAEAAEVAATLTKVAESWLSSPQRAVALQTQLWKSYISLWGNSLKRLTGEPVKDVRSPNPQDKRFQNPGWSQNVFFDFCKQLYLITSNWAEDAVKQAEGVDSHTKEKALFYVRQISAALSPSNFILTSPDLLQETLSSNGANLVHGMKMLAEDIRAGHGEIKLRQSDSSQFALGKNLAITKGAVVFQNDLIQLIQYAPTTAHVFKRPTLLVPPWINKFYILDLTEEKSLIKWMVDQGQTVFCISWINPDARLRDKNFEDYMREGILQSLEVISSITGESEVNAIGYCVGGTLLAATLAYLAEDHKSPIASATFLAAQVDFSYAGDLKIFADETQIEALEVAMQARGFLDSAYMSSTFNMLRANELLWPYFVNTYLRGQQPSAFDLLYWNSDSTRMTPANHSFYLRECYLKNSLSQGKMKLGGKVLNLKKITCPIYELATKEDHIAPAKSIFYGTQFFGGPVTFVLSSSGHIAGVVNPPIRNKYEYWTNDNYAKGSLQEWEKSAEKHQGSWWPHWQNWLAGLHHDMVSAREIESKNYPALEPAPGSYVRIKG